MSGKCYRYKLDSDLVHIGKITGRTCLRCAFHALLPVHTQPKLLKFFQKRSVTKHNVHTKAVSKIHSPNPCLHLLLDCLESVVINAMGHATGSALYQYGKTLFTIRLLPTDAYSMFFGRQVVSKESPTMKLTSFSTDWSAFQNIPTGLKLRLCAGFN